MKKTWQRFFSFAAALLLLLTAAPLPAHAASGGGISELRLASGKDAAAQLENSGYSVLYQDLNIGADGDAQIYLGYKLGGSPITDIVVGCSAQQSLTVGAVQYTLAADLDLNRGVGGVPLYLYTTQDPAAGSPIASLTTLTCGGEESSAVCPMLGDGSEAVRAVSGEAADLDLGVAGPELYLLKIRSGLCRPYIKNVRLVTASGEREAMMEVIRAGCNYFVDGDLSAGSDAVTYLCYDRTADPAEAITMLAVSNDGAAVSRNGTAMEPVSGGSGELYLFVSHDPALGNPITDITLGKLMGPKFTLGNWAMMYFGGTVSSALSQVCSEDAYYELLDDRTACVQIPADRYTGGARSGQTELMLTTQKKGLAEKLAAAGGDAAAEPVPEEASADTAEEFLTDGDARDEFDPLAEEKVFDAQDAPDASAYLAGTPEAFAMLTSDGDVSGTDVSGTDVGGLTGSTFGRGFSEASGLGAAAMILLAGLAVMSYLFRRGMENEKEAQTDGNE